MKRLGRIAAAALVALSPFVYTPAAAEFAAAVGEALPAEWKARVPETEGPLLIHFVDCRSARCEESLTAIEKFVAAPLAESGAGFVAFAVGASEKEAAELRTRTAASFDVLRDDGTLFRSTMEDAVPLTLITDGTGTIRYRHRGFSPGRDAEFRAVIEALLNDDTAILTRLAPMRETIPGDFSEELYARDIRGKQAPNVPVEVWINKPPAKEGKFLLVDFWATWCGPCIQTLEFSDPMHEQFADHLVTMAISDESEARVRAYVEQAGLKQPIGIDTQARAKNELGVRGIPHALLINPKGVVIFQGHPMVLWQNDAAELRKLLDSSKP